MANTFKVVTKANVTSADVIYTVASSTTTVVLGIMIGNTTTGQLQIPVTEQVQITRLTKRLN